MSSFTGISLPSISQSKQMIRKRLTSEAKKFQEQHSFAPEPIPSLSGCKKLGARYGVGIGLYFKILRWLQIIFLLLMITAVPYLVVINTSVFTDAPHKYDHEFGVKIYDPMSINSFSYGAIVSDSIDNGTLQYMNTDIVGIWKGPMEKATFLIWISLVDAGTIIIIALASAYFLWQAKRFVSVVDQRTLEAADYTVIVRGLDPSVSLHEIGRHFSRFGDVLEVILLRDMEHVLKLCEHASDLQYVRMVAAELHHCQETAAAHQQCKGTAAAGHRCSETAAAAVRKSDVKRETAPDLYGLGFEALAAPSQFDGETPSASVNGLERMVTLRSRYTAGGSADSPSAPAEGSGGVPGDIKQAAKSSVQENEDLAKTGRDSVEGKQARESSEAIAGVAIADSVSVLLAAALQQHDTEAVGGQSGTCPAAVDADLECGRGIPGDRKPEIDAEGTESHEAESKTAKKDREKETLARVLEGLKKMRASSSNKSNVGAALVMFNSEQARLQAMRDCPKGAFSSLFMKRDDRLEKRWSFWVERAKPPEDYIYENVTVPGWQRSLKVAYSRFVIFVILVLCGLIISKLSAESNNIQYTIYWFTDQMLGDIQAAANFAANTTVSTVATSAVINQTCAPMLSATCPHSIHSSLGAIVTFPPYQLITWKNATDQLLDQRAVFDGLGECADQGPASCNVSACLACYCYSLSTLPASSDTTYINTVNQQCNVYINQYNVKALGIKFAISLVITIINFFMKVVVRYLVKVERHETHSGEDLSYAFMCFISQLLNTAIVLLLVNAGQLSTYTAQGAAQRSWLKYIILSGGYPDFTEGWYEACGLSILMVLFINLSTPLIGVLTDLASMAGMRLWLSGCAPSAHQEAFHEAYAKPPFTLEERAADVMLNMTLALMFGSGLPLCYLIVACNFLLQDMLERLAIRRLYRMTIRYGYQLPYLIVMLLPYALVLHCALGLWMNTYFKPVNPDTFQVDEESTISSWVSAFQSNTTWARITQSNGIGLLLVGFLIAAALVLRALLLSPISAALTCGLCGQKARGSSGSTSNVCLCAEDKDAVHLTYEEALTGSPRILQGIPTYRVTQHPSYGPRFSNGLQRAILAAAIGPEAYTRLTLHEAPHGEVVHVEQELLLEQDCQVLRAGLDGLPSELAVVLAGMLESHKKEAPVVVGVELKVAAALELSDESAEGAVVRVSDMEAKAVMEIYDEERGAAALESDGGGGRDGFVAVTTHATLTVSEQDSHDANV